MTQAEFENLKVGDKVWYVCDWLDEECDHEKANELKVEGKDKKYGFVKTDRGELCLSGVYLTKAEAWEAEVEIMESAIKEGKNDLEEKRQKLDRYKAELAKAKEEESGWVIINEKVYKETPYISFPSTGFQKYPTEREAYEALAEYYKGKYEEALAKACDVRYCVSDKVIMFHDCCEAGKSDSDGEFYVRGKDYEDYDYCVKKSSCFNSRQEAEAELERRKKND